MIKGKPEGAATKARQTKPEEKTNTETLRKFSKVKEKILLDQDGQEPKTNFFNPDTTEGADKKRKSKSAPKPNLKPLSHDNNGQGFLPSTEPIIDATLESLANAMEDSRNAMMQAREQYALDEEALRLYMEDNGIKEPTKISNNRVAFLEDKIKARVRKEKGSSLVEIFGDEE